MTPSTPQPQGKLVVRPRVLEGDLVDVELEEAIKQHGWQSGIQILLHRRYIQKLEQDFLTAGLPPGVNGPVRDIEVRRNGKAHR